MEKGPGEVPQEYIHPFTAKLQTFRTRTNVSLFNVLLENLFKFDRETTPDERLIVIKTKIIDKIIDNAVNPERKGQEDEIDRVFSEIANLYGPEYGPIFSDVLRDIYMISKEHCDTNPTNCAEHIREILTDEKIDMAMKHVLKDLELQFREFRGFGGKKRKSSRKSKKSQRKSKKHHRRSHRK